MSTSFWDLNHIIAMCLHGHRPYDKRHGGLRDRRSSKNFANSSGWGTFGIPGSAPDCALSLLKLTPSVSPGSRAKDDRSCERSGRELLPADFLFQQLSANHSGTDDTGNSQRRKSGRS